MHIHYAPKCVLARGIHMVTRLDSCAHNLRYLCNQLLEPSFCMLCLAFHTQECPLVILYILKLLLFAPRYTLRVVWHYA